MKIIIDAMSGDHAPEAIVQGAVQALQFGEEIVLVGQEEKLRPLLKKEGNPAKITIHHAPDLVDMCDDPATVLRKKSESSMAVALKMLTSGEGDAVLSAGNTGALLTGATLFARRIKGVRRGALTPVLPTMGAGHCMIVDAGANTECTAEYLLQFGFMGSFYMRKMFHIEHPRVGLVNNGTEASKGDTLRKEAYALLKAAGDAGRLNFVGNIEGRDVLTGSCDVAVCDGFTGNVVLKTIEGAAKFMTSSVKDVFMENGRSKFAYVMVKSGINRLRKVLNYKETGGAPFLGIARPVIKAHGSSDAKAICSAVGQAIQYTNAGIIAEIENNVQYMTVEKAPAKPE